MKLARLAPLVAALALVGCTPSPTTAATVAGESIGARQVDDLIAGCPDLEATEPTAVTVLVQEKFFRHLAADRGVSFTEGEIDGVIDELGYGELVATSPACRAALVPQVANQLLGPTVTQEDFERFRDATPVQVNPRYGTWDPQKFAVSGSGSISSPIAKPTETN